jgi:peptidoglycan/LPS O-acetylase OafA/YrhL
LVFFLSGLAAVTAICVSVLLLADRFPMQYNQAPLRWLQKLGRRGYSFYLLHGPVTKATVLIMSAALGRSAGDWRVNLCLLALSLGLSILCTDILYNLVELPAVSWMQRHSKAFTAHA